MSTETRAWTRAEPRDPYAEPPPPTRAEVMAASEVLLRAGFHIEALMVLQVMVKSERELAALRRRMKEMSIARLGDLDG